MTDDTKEKRNEIDPVFKEVLTRRLSEYRADLQTEVEVSRLPRTIDALLTVEDKTERGRICEETPFFYLAATNQIEFKGIRDRLTKKEYHKIYGRSHFLLSERDIEALDTTVTIISAGKPNTVLKYAQALQRPFTAVPSAQGYYKCDGYPPVYLIVINELPITAKYYPLLIFASSEHKFREYLEQIVEEGATSYLRYAYEVRPQVTKEILIMAGISSRVPRENLEFMADDIGHDIVSIMDPEAILESMDAEKKNSFLALLSVEDLLKGISVEDLLKGISVEDLLKGISIEDLLKGISVEDLLKGISPEQRKALFEVVLKTLASDLASNDDDNTNGSLH